MTMSDLEVRMFNLVDRYAATIGPRLVLTPTLDASKSLWTFNFSNGRVVRLFDNDVTRDATAGALSDDTKKKIDGELS
jgi:hypothetical protein